MDVPNYRVGFYRVGSMHPNPIPAKVKPMKRYSLERTTVTAVPSCSQLVWSLGSFALLVTLLTCGCNRNVATGVASSSSPAAEQHDHHPAHWPATIFAASDRLMALESGLIGDAQPERVSIERELVDLIKWMPELAADTDLKEDAFNRIDSWSSKYLPVLEEQMKQGLKFDSMLKSEGLSEAIVQLNELVGAEKKRLESL